MNFDSIFFISCFLPVTLTAYWLVPGLKAKNWLLLLFSLLFYSFGSLQGLLLLLGCCLVNYGLGLWLRRGRGAKAAVILGVSLNVAFLGLYKYLDFILGQVLGLPQLAPGLLAPMGISFFTFKSISYLVDAYRDPSKATGSLPDLMLYITFFPQVVMGPITRFADFIPQLQSRSATLERTAAGLRRFVVGMGKKLLIAAALGRLVDGVYAMEAVDMRLAWLGAVGYSLQLYFDFSGSMDMVIGLGAAFGFETVENFNYPYIASTVGNFWRRWHISLSSWFKDYVYIPLGGNRKGKLRAGINKSIVFILCGIWHGANWTFVVWGLWHGLFSLLESVNLIPAKKLEKSRVWCHVYTLAVVCLGFVMFRADSLDQGFSMLAAMFTGFPFTEACTVGLHSLLSQEVLVMLVLGVILSMPVGPWLRSKKLAEPISYGAAALLLVLCIIKLAAGEFTPAIYARF